MIAFIPIIYNLMVMRNFRESLENNPDDSVREHFARAIVETNQDLDPTTLKDRTIDAVEDVTISKMKKVLQDTLAEILGIGGAFIGTAANAVDYDIDPLMMPPRLLEDGDTLMEVGVFAPDVSWTKMDVLDANILYGSLSPSTHNLANASSYLGDVIIYSGELLKESSLGGREKLFRWGGSDPTPGWEDWA